MAQGAAPMPTVEKGQETAVLAGGCFWGLDGVYRRVNGVTAVVSGWASQAESVYIVYDPSQVSYQQLLEIFFLVHDPTEKDRQGPDVGKEYRSAIFFSDSLQQQAAAAYVAGLTSRKVYKKKIQTEIVPLSGFTAAPMPHQNYLAKHPDSQYVIVNDMPKVELFKATYPALYKAPPSW
jgi:peptide-methionine (S)-S-oxide reductase